VIGRRDKGVLKPRDLQGRTVGVTGLPSDEAVLDDVVSANGGDPAKVHRLTIGFNAVSALAAGKVDAVTGFWSAEGIVLHHQGVPIRIFRVSYYGDAPHYPELVPGRLAKDARRRPGTGPLDDRGDHAGLQARRGRPQEGPGRPDRGSPQPSIAPNRANSSTRWSRDIYPAPFAPSVMKEWAAWDLKHGILEQPLDVQEAFLLKR